MFAETLRSLEKTVCVELWLLLKMEMLNWSVLFATCFEVFCSIEL